MKSITLIVSDLNIVGGLERIVTTLANELSRKGNIITILIAGTNQSIFYQLHTNVKVEFLEANFGIGREHSYLRRKFDSVNTVIKLKKKIEAIKSDIIISTDYTFTVALAEAKLYRKYKIISWQHSTFQTKKSKVWSLLIKRAYKRIHCIVALNKEEHKSFESLNGNVITIPNFVSPSSITSTLQNKEILTVARLVDSKGIDLLLQAALMVLQKHKFWNWKLIGNGSLKEEYQQYQYEIERLGLNNRFIHLQATYQNVEDYKDASIYVLPSRKESFGMVLIEAMNYGVPCIAFDCETGPRHIISSDEDGFLIEKENPKKLASAINILIENESLRKQMGRAAKENVEKYYDKVVIRQWEELFDKLFSLNNN